MSTELALYNRALGAVNARGRLSSLDDSGPLAEVCREWYPHVRRVVQEAAWWESCQAQVALALVSTSSEIDLSRAPIWGFQFAYALPAGYLRPWYLTNHAKFNIGYSPGLSRMILSTNVEDAVLIYAREQTAINFWTPGQINATVYGLAAMIAGQITGKQSIIRRNIELADNALLEARSISANNQNDALNYIPQAIRARTSGLNYQEKPAPFFWPYGPLFGETSWPT